MKQKSDRPAQTEIINTKLHKLYNWKYKINNIKKNEDVVFDEMENYTRKMVIDGKVCAQVVICVAGMSATPHQRHPGPTHASAQVSNLKIIWKFYTARAQWGLVLDEIRQNTHRSVLGVCTRPFATSGAKYHFRYLCHFRDLIYFPRFRPRRWELKWSNFDISNYISKYIGKCDDIRPSRACVYECLRCPRRRTISSNMLDMIDVFIKINLLKSVISVIIYRSTSIISSLSVLICAVQGIAEHPGWSFMSAQSHFLFYKCKIRPYSTNYRGNYFGVTPDPIFCPIMSF